MDPVLAGFLAGLGIAIVGYIKNSTKENFDLGKFLKTVAFGSIAGMGLGILGFDINYIQDTMMKYMPVIIMYSGVWTFESMFKGVLRMIKENEGKKKK